MNNKEDYRPARIEFNVVEDGSGILPNFGSFPTIEAAGKFMAGNLTCINKQMRVARWMDDLEKNTLRRDYSELLEDLLPVLGKEISQAENTLTDAKRKLKSAEESYNSAVDRAKNMAAEAKRGLRAIDLEAKDTFQVPYKGKYYYFTWIGKEVKLCHVADIPDYEKGDLFNQMAGNEQFIDDLKQGIYHEKEEPAQTKTMNDAGTYTQVPLTDEEILAREKGPVYREYKESPDGSTVTETPVTKTKGKKK